jgi:hypothetical protein
MSSVIEIDIDTLETIDIPVKAFVEILQILKYGKSKGYKPGSWRNEEFKHHLLKAKGHLMDYIYEIDRGEDHLACALTRLAMAVALRPDKQKTIKGE